MIDWQPIRAEYITGDLSYRALATKYGVNYNWLRERAKNENWVRKRQEHRKVTLEKTLGQISDQQADKLARIDALADQLLDKLETAIAQLDKQQCRKTERVRQVEYEEKKVSREVVSQQEHLAQEQTLVDRRGLKLIASALKDIREMKMLREEQDTQVEVVFAAGPGEWNE